MDKHALRDEGLTSVIVAVLITVALYYWYVPLAGLGIGLLLFVLYFFRDPIRTIATDDNLLYAACDGVVVEVLDVNEQRFIGGKAKAIHIFMSPANVHVNRSPIKGTVAYQEYTKGKFLPATKNDCYEYNERNYIGISNQRTKVLLVQVAGIMARRIVSWVETEQTVAQGEKIGMIKFSSGTRHFIDDKVEVLVKPGDRVFAGITPIGRLNDGS